MNKVGHIHIPNNSPSQAFRLVEHRPVRQGAQQLWAVRLQLPRRQRRPRRRRRRTGGVVRGAHAPQRGTAGSEEAGGEETIELGGVEDAQNLRPKQP